MTDFFRCVCCLPLYHANFGCVMMRVSHCVQCAVVRFCVCALRGHWAGAANRAFRETRRRMQCPHHTVQVYTFQTTTTAGGDEGVRLWVDGQLMIDAWATSRLGSSRCVGWGRLILTQACAVCLCFRTPQCFPSRMRCKIVAIFVLFLPHGF
jgi:hypothetical protein